MHAGLHTPDNRIDIGGLEARQVAQEIQMVLAAGGEAPVQAKVALVYDYEAKWLFEIHPQGADFHYPRFAFEYYSALRSLGLDVDVIPVGASLTGYRMIVVPPLPIVPRDFCERLAASDAQILLGPRTGSKTVDLHIPAQLPPGELAGVLPIRVWRVESMRPNVSEPVHGAETERNPLSAASGTAHHWRDLIETGDAVETLASFGDGHPAVVRHGNFHYCASLFDESFTQTLFEQVAQSAGLETQVMGDTLRVSRRGKLTYVFNYGETEHRIDQLGAQSFVLGGPLVEQQGVAIYRTA